MRNDQNAVGQRKAEGEPAWVARFLEALRTGGGVRAAGRAAGVSSSTPYHRREKDAAFRAAWDAADPGDGRCIAKTGPRAKRGAAKFDRFIAELAETSNVTAAARVADLTIGAVYRERRSDPEFARRWYAALAEGYDNLEMELLGRLRSGDTAAAAGDAPAPKFDTTAAIRCLTAHRDSVAREKGRRTLAEEVTTIASINAKIDALRARQKENRRKIATARGESDKKQQGDG